MKVEFNSDLLEKVVQRIIERYDSIFAESPTKEELKEELDKIKLSNFIDVE